MINRQISLAEIMNPDAYDPLYELAKQAGCFFTDSKQTIIDCIKQQPSNRQLAVEVRKQYSPYGCAGHYGSDGDGLNAWNFASDHIQVTYTLDGERKTIVETWENFALAIWEAYKAGQYL